MKIRTRLSLQFITLFAILLSCALLSIYFVVANQWHNNFFKHLEDRAFTVGHNYLAEDNFTPAEFTEVLRKFPRTLPNEEIRIYTTDFKPVYIAEGDLKWNTTILKTVVRKHKIQFMQGHNYVVGVFYEDNSGNYIVMAKATDVNGANALTQLQSVMLFSLCIALAITFLLARYFANYLLRPIKQIIQHIQLKNVETLVHPIPTDGMSKDEIKTLSEDINSLCERLHESFDKQQSFIAHASHELKTPIASLMGNAEIALQKPRSIDEYKDVLQGTVKEALHMDQIIGNLLAISQIDSTVYPLQLNAFEPFWWTMIDQLIVQNPKLNLNLVIKTKEDLCQLYFDGNNNLLQLALSNIILNADKFSFHEAITLSLDTTSTAILITVADEGIGIKPEDMDKLLLPFYRSNNALGIQGTGLGLSLASKIIHLHKAKLLITSKLNTGTTVCIEVPKSLNTNQ